ncbi:MAG: serine/threonine protein kinase/WD40 repeat protein [Planctomycetota bacterium]|jgi:serine/threonine protein kinase/WD40 repeat protein
MTSPTEPQDDEERAAAFDFLSELLEDRDSGVQRPLAEYLAHYPGHEDAVAVEYARYLEEERAAASAAEQPAGAEDGPSIGHYRLLRLLGKGGQGEVWLAEDPRLRREVAIKRLMGLVTEDRRLRLEREARAAARLAHPGICGLLDADLTCEEPYLVMEYIEGEDMAAKLARARLARSAGTGQAGDESGPWIPRDQSELSELLNIFESLLRALHVAHMAGLVHRDVKPGNVLMAKDGTPVLLDFGLATGDDQDLQLTREGDVFGTPAYMAPEQVRGEPGDSMDGTTDVFAAGIMLFQALTGSLPFQSKSMHGLARAIIERPLPKAKSGSWTLPLDVQAVLQHACEKETSARYPTALAFAEDLRRVQAWEPVHARHIGPVQRISRWARRERVLARSLLAIIVIVGLSFGLLKDSWRSQAESSLETVKSKDHELGTTLADSIPDLLARCPAAALALGIEALNRTQNNRARRALYGPMEQCRLLARYASTRGSRPLDFLVREGAREMLMLDKHGGVSRWDLDNPGSERGERLLSLPGIDSDRGMLVPFPDGVRVAYALSQGGVGVIDLEAGRLLWSLPGDGTQYGWVAIDPSGARLAVQATEGATHVYAAQGGEVLLVIPGEQRRAALVRFHPSEDLLLTSGARRSNGIEGGGQSAHLWNGTSGELVAELVGHQGAIRWAEFDSDGMRIATTDAHGRLRLWHGISGAPEGVPTDLGGSLGPARFGPQGDWLAVGAEQGTWLIALDGTIEPRFLDGHASRVQTLAFTPDGQRLLTGAFDTTVRCWSVASGEFDFLCRAYMRPTRLELSADGQRLYVGDIGEYLHAFRMTPAPYAYGLGVPGRAISWTAFDDSGERALLGDTGGGLSIHATPSQAAGAGAPSAGAVLFQRQDHGQGLVGGELGPGGSVLTYTAAGELALWNRARPLEPARMGALLGPLKAAAFARDGTPFLLDAQGKLMRATPAAAGLQLDHFGGAESEAFLDLACLPSQPWVLALRSDALCVLDLHDGDVLATLTWDKPGAQALGFAEGSSNGRVAVRCADMQLRIFDVGAHLASGTPEPLALNPILSPELATFVADRLVSANAGGPDRVRALPLRNLSMGESKELGVMPVERTSGTERSLSATVTCLGADPAGELLVMGTAESTVWVWDVQDGGIVSSNDLHAAPLRSVHFSPGTGEKRILSLDTAGQARIWPVRPGSEARMQKPRDLDRWERERWLPE